MVMRYITSINSLPDFVVNVDSINIFKSRLDKYWINQDIVFDYTADLAGTGDRSEYRSFLEVVIRNQVDLNTSKV